MGLPKILKLLVIFHLWSINAIPKVALEKNHFGYFEYDNPDVQEETKLSDICSGPGCSELRRISHSTGTSAALSTLQTQHFIASDLPFRHSRPSPGQSKQMNLVSVTSDWRIFYSSSVIHFVTIWLLATCVSVFISQNSHTTKLLYCRTLWIPESPEGRLLVSHVSSFHWNVVAFPTDFLWADTALVVYCTLWDGVGSWIM